MLAVKSSRIMVNHRCFAIYFTKLHSFSLIAVHFPVVFCLFVFCQKSSVHVFAR